MYIEKQIACITYVERFFQDPPILKEVSAHVWWIYLLWIKKPLLVVPNVLEAKNGMI
jgi:hypothetical protein